MLNLKITPRLFISYAIEDKTLAESLNAALLLSCYQTFFDKKSIQIGDVFPERIISAIKKCDGILIIVSSDSIKSEWCKLEAYYAHFFKKPLIPVKRANIDYDSESPLRSIQKDIQYTIIENTTSQNEAIERLKDRLCITRKNAISRIYKLIFIILGIGLFIVFIFAFGINRINRLTYYNEKSDLLENLKTSNKILQKPEIEIINNKFNNDISLITQMHFLETDPEHSEASRINYKILSGALLKSHSLVQREYFINFDWANSILLNNKINNSTFGNGSIAHVDFKKVSFNDVYFSGIENDQRGTVLSDLEFSNCSFNATYFDGCNAIDISFKACRFRGSYFNTTNFSIVRFNSAAAKNPYVITNGELTYFENCIFENVNKPDQPGVLVMGIENEIQFKGVVFDRCRFVGFIRSQWFNECSFHDCVFPNDSILLKLQEENIFNKNSSM